MAVRLYTQLQNVMGCMGAGMVLHPEALGLEFFAGAGAGMEHEHTHPPPGGLPLEALGAQRRASQSAAQHAAGCEAPAPKGLRAGESEA